MIRPCSGASPSPNQSAANASRNPNRSSSSTRSKRKGSPSSSTPASRKRMTLLHPHALLLAAQKNTTISRASPYPSSRRRRQIQPSWPTRIAEVQTKTVLVVVLRGSPSAAQSALERVPTLTMASNPPYDAPKPQSAEYYPSSAPTWLATARPLRTEPSHATTCKPSSPISQS